jgi:hypothetical protein
MPKVVYRHVIIRVIAYHEAYLMRFLEFLFEFVVRPVRVAIPV